MENLELWNKVWKTTSDTKTKEVSYWARKFTAIDAYSQIKTATNEFGKYWEKWGFKKLEYQVVEWRLYFEGLFFYPSWEFPIMNDCKVWDDASKKVFTDSLTKALSYLGFNADVFMGQFEWNKYTWWDSKPKQDDNLPWIWEENIAKLRELVNSWTQMTMQQVREKYKVSKQNRYFKMNLNNLIAFLHNLNIIVMLNN